MPFWRFVKQSRQWRCQWRCQWRWPGLLLITSLLCACQPVTVDALSITFFTVQTTASSSLSSSLSGAIISAPNGLALHDITSPNTSPDMPAPVRAALVERGTQLYLQQYCGACHSLSIVESKGTFGPPHDDIAAVALQRLQDPQYAGTATTAADYLRESLVDPGIYVADEYLLSPHRMPTYAHLPEEDIAALVEMLLQQR